MRFQAFFFCSFVAFPNSSVSFRHPRNCLCVEININISVFFLSLVGFFVVASVVGCHKFMSDCYILCWFIHIYNVWEYSPCNHHGNKIFPHIFVRLVFSYCVRAELALLIVHWFDTRKQTQKKINDRKKAFCILSWVLFVFFFFLDFVLSMVDSRTHIFTHRQQWMMCRVINSNVLHIYFSAVLVSPFVAFTPNVKVIHDCHFGGLPHELNATKQKLIDRLMLLSFEWRNFECRKCEMNRFHQWMFGVSKFRVGC